MDSKYLVGAVPTTVVGGSFLNFVGVFVMI